GLDAPKAQNQSGPSRFHALGTNMANPASRLTTRLAYGARQFPRVAWYVGHSLVMRRLAEIARKREGEQDEPRPATGAPAPDRRRLYADMAALFQQDLANVEAGIHPV